MIAVTTALLTAPAKAFCAVPVSPLFSQGLSATQVTYQRPTLAMAVEFWVAVGIMVAWMVKIFGRKG